MHRLWMAWYKARLWYVYRLMDAAQSICPHPFLEIVSDQSGFVMEVCTVCRGEVDAESDIKDISVSNPAMWN